MLEIAVIRSRTDEVKQRLAKKNFKELNLIDDVLGADEKRRNVQTKLDENLAKQNSIAKEIGELFKQGKKDEAGKRKNETSVLKEQSKQLETELEKAEEDIRNILIRIPNMAHTSVPVGKSPEENEVVVVGLVAWNANSESATKTSARK